MCNSIIFKLQLKGGAVRMCMIKIFRGGRGGDTFKTPYEQLLPLPTSCFKMFLERSLNPPKKKIDHTQLAKNNDETTFFRCLLHCQKKS